MIAQRDILNEKLESKNRSVEIIEDNNDHINVLNDIKGILERMEKNEDIELVSLAHFRGRTFENSVVIVDEFQNLTKQQLSMVLGRLGKGSTMILTGDPQQIDLKFSNDSAVHDVPKLKPSQYVYSISLQDNHRHEALDELLQLLQNYS